MKRFLLSLTAAVTLFTTSAVANTTNNITSGVHAQQQQQNEYKQFLFEQGLESTAALYYDYLYVLQGNKAKGFNKKNGLKAYRHFKDMYITLVNAKDTLKYKYTDAKGEFGRPLTKVAKDYAIWYDDGNLIAETIFFDKMIKESESKGDFEERYFLLQQLIGATITYREQKGLSTQLTYTVQKRVGKTAVTITLNLPQIIKRYADFLQRLKLYADSEEQFNDYFQNLAVIMYWIQPTYFNFKDLGPVTSRMYSFAQYFVKNDVLSPIDFVHIIFGENFASETELAHNKRLAKLVNYILVKDYDKAIKIVIHPDPDIIATKNFILKVLQAEAGLEMADTDLGADYIITDPDSKILAADAKEIVNSLPEDCKVKSRFVVGKAFRHIHNKAVEITEKTKNIPDLRSKFIFDDGKLHTDSKVIYYAGNICFSIAKRKYKNNDVLGHYKACILNVAEQIKNKANPINAYQYDKINKIYKENPEVKKSNKEFQEDFCGKIAGEKAKKACNFWLDYHFKEAERKGIK